MNDAFIAIPQIGSSNSNIKMEIERKEIPGMTIAATYNYTPPDGWIALIMVVMMNTIPISNSTIVHIPGSVTSSSGVSLSLEFYNNSSIGTITRYPNRISFRINGDVYGVEYCILCWYTEAAYAAVQKNALGPS